jgi:hypothetical protein
MLEFRATEDEPEASWVELSKRFVSDVYNFMPRETGWFHQTGVTPDNRPSRYHMFEFWMFDKDPKLVITKVQEIGEHLDLPLTVTL